MNAQPEFIDAEVVESPSLKPASQALAERSEARPAPYVSGAVTPMEMLDRALASGRDLETIEKLMGLQERWEAGQARKAFNEAFAAFKAEAITIARNRRVTDGPLKGRSYAELVSFVEAATPALSKHGLSASWDITRDEKDWIEVTCTVEHVLGGNKKVALGGPPDTGGAKNPLQARISTVTYLERATFKAACGLAEQGDDTDGNAPKVHDGSERITDAQLKRLLALLDETGSDTKRFCELGKINSVADLHPGDFDAAVRMLEQKKAKLAALGEG